MTASAARDFRRAAASSRSATRPAGTAGTAPGGVARPPGDAWGRAPGRLSGSAVGRLETEPRFRKPPNRQTAKPPSSATSRRRPRTRSHNQQRQISRREIGARDALDVIAGHREQPVEIGVDLVDRAVEGAVVMKLLGLAQSRLPIANEAGAQRILRLLELGGRDAVGADRVELSPEQAVQTLRRDPLIDDAVDGEYPGSVPRAE